MENTKKSGKRKKDLTASGGGAEVLIVDDDEGSRLVAGKILEQNDYIVHEAPDGTEALAFLDSHHPDLILLDIRLPGADGYEICKKLQADEETRDIPILFVTVLDEEENETKGLALGAVDYIFKPVTPAVLLARVNTHMALKRQREKLGEQNIELLNTTNALEQEILERKRTEEALQESEDRYRQLFSSSSDAIFVFNADTLQLEEANQTASELYGYTKEDFSSLKITDLSAEKEKTLETIRKIKLGDPAVRRIPLRYFKKKDGTIFPGEVSTGFFRSGGGIKIIGSVRDISVRMRIEEELRRSQKMEAIGTLASGIAHDFNNILGAMLGYTEMTKYSLPENSPGWNDLDEVLKAGKRAAALVNQILTFSRHTECKLIPSQLGIITKEALKFLRASTPTSVEIRRNIAPACGAVMADSTQIYQLLMNLWTNAVQAMNEKGVLEVGLTNVDLGVEETSVFPKLSPGPYVKLTVSDTGPGMDKKTMERIFDPFFTTKEVGKGTGMGLSMVHGIVENHGGVITVESEPGKGASFHVFFPKISAEEKEEQTEPSAPLPTGNERILFVDDENAMAGMGAKMLERLGYEVVSTTDSEKALELFRTGPSTFDLVITDQTMPKMTGDELAMKLLAVRPDIPIILCTGYSSLISEEKALELGMRGYLKKPVDMVTLAEAVRKVLHHNTPS